MDRPRQTHAIVAAHAVLAEAKARKIRPKSRVATRKEVVARQRVTFSSIERKRVPATRRRRSQRAQTSQLLVTELNKTKVRATKSRAEADRLLGDAFVATCAARPSKPIRNESERKIAQRCAPLRFVVDLGKERTLAATVKLLTKKLGVKLSTDPNSWPSVEPLFRLTKRHRYFVLTLPLSRTTGGRKRFLIAQAIKRRCGALSVQPDEPVTIHGWTVDLLTGPPPLDTEWPLETMRVRNGWGLDPTGSGRRLGAGETIGHLDTGWFDHPEYDQSQIDLTRAYNSVTDAVSETAAAHSYEGPGNETHGVATGSLMVSRPADPGTTTITTVPSEPAAPANDGLQISGIAPEATVLPVRCLDSVFVLMNNVDLVRGAEYLIEPQDPSSPAKVGVISMSLGGVPHFTLEDVLNVGIRDKNVIAVAAAGQVYVAPLPVAAPAAYPEVIAIAASNPDDEPAYWTFSGPEIDVAAPGESVWIADVRGEEQRDGSIDVKTFIGYGHGTSFSCAMTAGVAALWRSFYNDALTSGEYDEVPLAHVFRQHLRETARTPRGWDTTKFGAGIVDVEALLSTPLPGPDDVSGPPAVAAFNPFIAVSDGFEDAVDAWDGLVDFSSELADHLATLGRDTANAVAITIAEMAADGAAFAEAAMTIGLQVAERTAAATVEFVGAVWTDVAAFADAAGDEVGRRAAAVANDLAEVWDDAVQAAEDAAEEAAEAIEEAAEEVVEVVEEIAEAVGEGAEDVVDFIVGLFG